MRSYRENVALKLHRGILGTSRSSDIASNPSGELRGIVRLLPQSNLRTHTIDTVVLKRTRDNDFSLQSFEHVRPVRLRIKRYDPRGRGARRTGRVPFSRIRYPLAHSDVRRVYFFQFTSSECESGRMTIDDSRPCLIPRGS